MGRNNATSGGRIARLGSAKTENMRLADFILRDMERILAEWETFAATHLPAAATMDSLALRDHAPDILQSIALDLRSSQGLYEPVQKATGRAQMLRDTSHTAAQTHALLRAQVGFSVVQLASEYRALRASVLRLWAEASRHSAPDLIALLEDTRRFNEAIDQALVESIAFFSQEVERSRNLLLAIVGHDLRNPLDTIMVTAHYLSKLRIEGVGPEVIARLSRSGARIKHLLDDLLDYNRATLGNGIPIAVADIDLAEVCALEIDGLQTAHPDRVISFIAKGNLRGVWDAARIQQILSNLLKNALDYGARDAAIEVQATELEREVLLSVRNRGAPIPPATLRNIFEPLRRGAVGHDRPETGSNLGLGLFIAQEIARAHGGTIHVSSDEHETTFTVNLPRGT
jgi:signal transduction histidine kinase